MARRSTAPWPMSGGTARSYGRCAGTLAVRANKKLTGTNLAVLCSENSDLKELRAKTASRDLAE